MSEGELKHILEFAEGLTKPVRNCGTRWIAHTPVWVVYGAPTKDHLRNWKSTSVFLYLRVYMELLTPISQLSLSLQKEEINPGEAKDDLDVIKKLKRMKDIENETKTSTVKNFISVFRKKNFPGELKNIDDGKKERGFNLVATVIEVRVEEKNCCFLHISL